jgi:hypothetical protein
LKLWELVRNTSWNHYILYRSGEKETTEAMVARILTEYSVTIIPICYGVNHDDLWTFLQGCVPEPDRLPDVDVNDIYQRNDCVGILSIYIYIHTHISIYTHQFTHTCTHTHTHTRDSTIPGIAASN